MTQSENAKLAALFAVVERMDREAKEDRSQRRAEEEKARIAREQAVAAANNINVRVARLEVKMDREILGQQRLNETAKANHDATLVAATKSDARDELSRTTKSTILLIVTVAGFFATLIGNAIADLVVRGVL